MAYEYRHHHVFGAVAMIISIGLFSAHAFRASAASVKAASDTLSLEKALASAVHTVTMNVGALPLTGNLDLNYPGFLSFGSFTTSSACIPVAPAISSGTTVRAALVGCTGTITFGFTALNPGVTASNLVTITGVAQGAFAIPTIAEDTISVTATVDPSITFDVGATAAACDGTFVSSNWNVDLGLLSTARRIASSDDPGYVPVVKHICTLLSTNATGGAIVTAKNTNGANGLVSASVPADKIPSVSAAVNNSVPNYGMCFTATRGHNAAAVPPSNVPSIASSVFFNGAVGTNCTNSIVSGAESLVAFSGAPQEVWRVTGVTDRSFATLFVKAGISATQPSHNDYADAITFVATASY